MAVLYNIDPFSALEIIYQGKTDGFSDEDFERNENERGIIVPQILKNFLKSYGYMTVNRLSDSVRILHPNIMSQRVFRYGEGGELPLMMVGRVGEFQVAIADRAEYDPEIFLLKTTPEQTQILPSDDTISEIFKVMTSGILLKTENAVIVDDPEIAVRMLRENGIDLERIEYNRLLRREYSLCFSEKLRTFVVAEFVEGDLSRFFFARSESFIAR